VNLLENAAKYTPPSSPVEIAAKVETGRMIVSVSDRGPGLPLGSEARIFEKFFRGGAPGIPGAGLGLAICRGVVEAHGGTISATSRDGGGAVFAISLPLASPPVMQSDGDADLEPASSVGAR